MNGDIDSMPTDVRVRQLDALLRRHLGLESPLEDAVKLLDGAARLDFERGVLADKAFAARRKLARGIALGEIQFDDDSVAEFDTLNWHLVSPQQEVPAARALVEYVGREAEYEAGNRLVTTSGQIWDSLVTDCKKTIGKLEALPKPPKGLFIHPNPVDELAKSEEHAATLSVLLTTGARFELIHRAAAFVRDMSGHGSEQFPDGAPSSAGVYRAWRRMMETEIQLGTIHRHLRIWWALIEGWQPGLWSAEDIEAPTAEENKFGNRLARLGFAVQ